MTALSQLLMLYLLFVTFTVSVQMLLSIITLYHVIAAVPMASHVDYSNQNPTN